MTREEKVEALKKWLSENGYEYKENYSAKKVKIDLAVLNPKVAVRMADEDQKWYRDVCRVWSPFFIRESETVEFIIEKMTNCIAAAKEKMPKPQPKPKRKRMTVRKVEKIVPRGC